METSSSNRANEIHQDARHRTDVLETHVRKELESLSVRVEHGSGEVDRAIKALRHAQKEAFTALEQRLARIEDHTEASIARVNRESRELAAGYQPFADLEQRIAKIEDRVEASLARIERETREQLLDQAKSFLDQLERARDQLRAALVQELGLEPAPLEEGLQHDDAWTASH